VPGGFGILCGGRAPRRRCQIPGCREWAAFECDYPTAKGTCDLRICRGHRVAIAPDVDYCEGHVLDDWREEREARA
jgi:hypothetical protein